MRAIRYSWNVSSALRTARAGSKAVLETFTDPAGYYRFTEVPAGEVNVRAFFTGREAQSAAATVAPGQVVQRDIALAGVQGRADPERGPIKLAEYVVTEKQQMEGAAIAINEQRFAPNFKTVVSADEFGAASESDIGEFMKFLPGVQMRDDQRDFHQSVGGREHRTRKVLTSNFPPSYQ